MVLSEIEEDGQQHGYNLARYRGDGSARYFQARHAEKSKDQDRVQDNIDDSPGSLGDHRVEGLACGLEQTLKADLQKGAEGADGYKKHIVLPVFYNLGMRGLAGKNKWEQVAPKRANNT